jgi:hypothetical protein
MEIFHPAVFISTPAKITMNTAGGCSRGRWRADTIHPEADGEIWRGRFPATRGELWVLATRGNARRKTACQPAAKGAKSAREETRGKSKIGLQPFLQP